MARVKDDIGFACYLILEDGVTVKPMEEITEEERDKWNEGMTRRLTENMSNYYRRHKAEAVAKGVWEAVTAGWPEGYWEERQE